MIDPLVIENFKHTVWAYFAAHQRSMPWRQNTEPYYILVSEVMLQQTQVDRVIPKFQTFIHTFPTVESLAAAPLSAVLAQWVGLGYNRRAKWLHEAAQIIVQQHKGSVPHTIEELTALKGIGKHTAGAILNYAFNQPVSFIETNIRTVYLHEFFHGQTAVGDEALEPYIELSLDKKRSREWHWALMDYGSFLKKTFPNPSRRSASYKKQTKFEGSRRQIRGMIIRELLAYKQSIDQLSHKIKDERLHSVLEELAKEEIIQSVDGIFELTDTPQLP